MSFSKKDDGVEEKGNKQSNGQGLIPLIADVDYLEQMLKSEIHEADDRVVESHNHQCSDGEIGNDIGLDTIQ